MFPEIKGEDRITWSNYREELFDRLCGSQSSDGSWQGGGGWSVGPVFSTAVACCIMQLDNNVLPVYQR